MGDTVENEVEVEVEKKTMTWEELNLQVADGNDNATEGHYITTNGVKKYVGGLLSRKAVVSDSGYETAYRYTNEVYEWAEEEPHYAFRLFKRNPLGRIEYTPWIPAAKNSDGEVEAMYAYAQLLKTGVLPKVDRTGKLVGGK